MAGKHRYDLAMADANEAVRLGPGLLNSYQQRGKTWLTQGEYARALADYDIAVSLGTNVAASYRMAPWLLATCPDAQLPRRKTRLEDASKAYQLSPIIIEHYADPDGPYGHWFMQTLAAAYAENGDFKAAIAWQQKALEKIPERDKDYAEAQHQLETYKSGKPLRDEPKAAAPPPPPRRPP